jgi:putative sigma-54 modulation protein
MKVEIIHKNFNGSEDVLSYVRKKVTKLSRYLPNLDEAKVEIREENTKSPKDRFGVQITVNAKGTLLRAEERKDSVQTAADAAVEVIARQIKRFKGKRYNKGRGVSVTRGVLGSEGSAVKSRVDSSPSVVKIKKFPTKVMSIEEASEQMELLSHDFFLFVSEESGSLSLLYRRRDGNYGLIEPELS